MPSDEAGAAIDIEIVAAHWTRFGQALAGAIDLEADDRTSAAHAPADVVRDALRFRAVTALESVRALHDTGGVSLFRLLHEVPVDGRQDALCWRSLIAMRNLMIHQWWTIDDSIVRATVRNDFPILHGLAASVQILPTPQDDPLSARANVEAIRGTLPASVVYLDRAIGLRRLILKSP